MSITSLSFLLFIFAVILLYFAVPARYQWIVLLVMSWVFYLSVSVKAGMYVLMTAITVYAGTRYMDVLRLRQKEYLKTNKNTLTKEEKNAYKEQGRKKRRLVMLVVLLFNLGILGVFKYFHFALEQVNAILRLFGSAGITDRYRFLVPLGISFYTFQSVGYLLDVYWEKAEAEKNFFKVLLFVSFFPQMTQGPISDFKELTGQLFAEHSFSGKNYTWGLQRMTWGFFKKMIVADALAPCVSNVFANYSSYAGIAVLIGAFCYSIQIYADFSGYMDIMCGFCEVLGIHLTENFERPYFSKSVTEYWRRWHMSMGTWFKKYVYYPIGMSSWSRKLAKRCREKFGKHLSNTIPATIALVITWLATGLWHGASWAYVTWGLLNGLFLILSLWLEPFYAKTRTALKIKEESSAWKVFQIIRTFILVTFIKVLPEVGTLSDGLGLWKQIFTNHTVPRSLGQLLPFLEPAFTRMTYVFLVLGIILMIVFSWLQEKKPVREYFNTLPVPARIAMLSVLIIIISSYGVIATWNGGGFMYAQF